MEIPRFPYRVSDSMIVVALSIITIFIAYVAASDAAFRHSMRIAGAASPADAPYIIDGESVLLKNGVFEHPAAPGSASKETFRLFGRPTFGNLDDDPDTDAAVIIQRSGGGSGTFYYAALAFNTKTGYQGTPALFLGDRIAPQNIEINHRRATVNFADRGPDEPFTVPPSIGRSVTIHYDPATGEIGELALDFEGEADPTRMNLTMKTWTLTSLVEGGKDITPTMKERFSLSFSNEGKVAITTDCNNMGGTYTAKGSTLTFSELMSTKMFCDGSWEGQFVEIVSEAKSFSFTGKGELLLNFDKDGTATFR